MLAVSGTARFVSDIHLREERPDITGRFFSFLADTAEAKVAHLFILGDLFEYWIGDDDLDHAFNTDVVDHLKTLTTAGTRLYLLHGNRDFLLGAAFCAASGATLLDDDSVVSIDGTTWGLQHGDLLCTDDRPYQEFRRLVRSDDWQRRFLGRSLAERRAEVAELRRRSADAMKAKAAAIMDANADAVAASFIASACTRLIHGHTHRPGHHSNEGGAGRQRWVLSDWDTGRGDALELRVGEIRRLDCTGELAG